MVVSAGLLGEKNNCLGDGTVPMCKTYLVSQVQSEDHQPVDVVRQASGFWGGVGLSIGLGGLSGCRAVGASVGGVGLSIDTLTLDARCLKQNAT